jgi:glycine betaine catabolism B
MSSSPHTVPVVDIIQETIDTQTFRFGGYFPYKAGQAIALTIPGDPKKRFYSLSSSPTEKDHLAITIKADRTNLALYGSLFSLKKGSQVEVAGPLGSFTLPDDLKGPFYFLGAGSGVTPFRSMIKFLQDTQPATEIWLIHSARVPEDLLFKSEFEEWSKNVMFHYIPTFTRWTLDGYTGETGRIGEALLRKHLTLDKGLFFLCGPSAFVKDMEQVIGTTLAIPIDRIRREQWGT